MNEDPRCCGSGTCIIDAEGRCWCGQQWDGQTMCRPVQSQPTPPEPEDAPAATNAPITTVRGDSSRLTARHGTGSVD